MSIKMIDEVIGQRYDVWPSEISVKVDKKAARDLLAKFKNPKEKKTDLELYDRLL